MLYVQVCMGEICVRLGYWCHICLFFCYPLDIFGNSGIVLNKLIFIRINVIKWFIVSLHNAPLQSVSTILSVEKTCC